MGIICRLIEVARNNIDKNKRFYELTFPLWPVTNLYVALIFLNAEESVQLPQRVVCQQCGRVLYEGAELKPPDEIIHAHNGKCPGCGKKLSLIPIDVDVKPMKGK